MKRSNGDGYEALLDLAEKRRAVMAIFPELCTTPRLVEQAKRWFQCGARGTCEAWSSVPGISQDKIPRRAGENRAEALWAAGGLIDARQI